jgi:c-di-GMP-binding flagellar brake protein YcgR
VSGSDDRRAAARKPLHTRAVVRLAGRAFEVRTFDISSGGIGIYAEINPKIGMVVELQCTLLTRTKGPQPVQTMAKVSHSVYSSDGRGFKVGLTFVELDPPSAQAISLFMG